MRRGMGWMFRELCRWEVGGTSGMVTDGDSEIFGLDDLECEVVGGACGAADRQTDRQNTFWV